MGPGPANHHAHFSGDLLAPTFRPVEPRAPLSLPPGGQSSWRGCILGAGSSGSCSLGLRPRFFPPARLFSSFLGTSDSWLLCLGGESAEVRNQFWGERNSRGGPGTEGPQEAEATWTRSTRGAGLPRWPLTQTSPPTPTPAPHTGCATHLCVGLEDVVLDATLRAELLRTQQTAVLPHQVVSLQDTAARPQGLAQDFPHLQLREGGPGLSRQVSMPLGTHGLLPWAEQLGTD